MSHLANLTPRSPLGMSPEERTQRRSLKAGSQVEVDPSKELTEPGGAMTTSGKHDPHARGNRDHHPQKYATKKQACDTSSNRAPRRCHVLIVGRAARLVFGSIGEHWPRRQSGSWAPWPSSSYDYGRLAVSVRSP